MPNARHSLPAAFALVGLLAFAGPARALDMTVGDIAIENLGSFGFTSNASVLSMDGGTTDELYQMFGYLGTATGVEPVSATYFDVVSSITAVGNVASSVLELNAAGASALGLVAGDVRIEYTFTLTDLTGPDDADQFLWDFNLTNQIEAGLGGRRQSPGTGTGAETSSGEHLGHDRRLVRPDLAVVSPDDGPCAIPLGYGGVST